MFGRRRERDALLAAHWERALAFAVAPPRGPRVAAGTCLGQIVGRTQPARTGTKAWVRWWATGEVTAAWFECEWPAGGVFVVATGSLGPGVHHAGPAFYVDAGQLRSVLPPNAPAAFDRHRRRQAASPVG